MNKFIDDPQTSCEPRVAQCQEWADRAVNAVTELGCRIEELEKRLGPIIRSEPLDISPNPKEEEPQLVPMACVFRELWRKNDKLIGQVRTLLDRLEI